MHQSRDKFRGGGGNGQGTHHRVYPQLTLPSIAQQESTLHEWNDQDDPGNGNDETAGKMKARQIIAVVPVFLQEIWI